MGVAFGRFTSAVAPWSTEGRFSGLRSGVFSDFERTRLRPLSALELSLSESELELLSDELLDEQLQFEPHEQLESEPLESDDDCGE